jgi:hypothetical protein
MTERCRRRHAPKRSRFRGRGAYPLIAHRTRRPTAADPVREGLLRAFADLADSVHVRPYTRGTSVIIAAGRRVARRRRLRLVLLLALATPTLATAGLWLGLHT